MVGEGNAEGEAALFRAAFTPSATAEEAPCGSLDHWLLKRYGAVAPIGAADCWG